MKQRFWRLMTCAAVLLALGLGYAFLCYALGGAIPCVFHWVTGFYCPGCGMTRMCLALLRLDFSAAWRANPALFLLLPGFAALTAQQVWRYLRTGSHALSRRQNVAVWVMIVVLLTYAVLRNLPVLAALIPVS